MLELILNSNVCSSFLKLYQTKPYGMNEGGMRELHSFYLWLMLKKINPKVVIESGVWRGCSTWLIEETIDIDTQLYCLDPNVNNISFYTYRSDNAIYSDIDFTKYDFPKLEHALLILDDHIDVLPRLKRCLDLKIKYVIIDDDYISNTLDRDHVSFSMCERFYPNEIIDIQEAIVCKYRFPSELDPKYGISDGDKENQHRTFLFLEFHI